MPALGTTETKAGVKAARARTCSVMGPGPVEQLRPTQSGRHGSTMAATASTVCPPRVVPPGSMVAETATGTPGAASVQAISAALMLRASWAVSTRRTSAPPAARASAWTR